MDIQDFNLNFEINLSPQPRNMNKNQVGVGQFCDVLKTTDKLWGST